MVGKEDKPHPTQEQLRIARLTQETTHSNDTDDARFLKLLKKVMETTRCSQTVAEIALYDTDNNVEAAVDAILEKSLSDDWQKQKSRKTKKQENEEELQRQKEAEQRRQQQNQNRAYRGNQARRGGHGAAGNGGERRGLGVRGGRGGAKPFRGGAGGGAGGGNGRIGTWQQEQENTWDNSMASNPTWTADDTAEDTEWRKDDLASPSSGSAAAPSFAAVAASAVKCVDAPPAVSSANDLRSTVVDHQTPAVYDRSLLIVIQRHIFSSLVTSSLLDTAATDGRIGSADNYNRPTNSPLMNQSAPANTQQPLALNGPIGKQMNNAVNVNHSTKAPGVAAWTQQLKNDLGIGGGLSRLPPSANTVEFVSGDANSTSALPEYQFGFYPDSSEHISESSQIVEPIYVATSTGMPSNLSSRSTAKSVPDVPLNLSNGSLSQMQQQYNANISGDISRTTNTLRQQNYANTPYADTNTVSYTTSKAQPASHSLQQQQQMQFNTAAPLTYNFPYMNMNMYSPVTGSGLRAEDPFTAAMLQQYPFGMGLEMSALSTMLPPVPNQHSRNEQQHSAFSQDYGKIYGGSSTNVPSRVDVPTSVAPPPGFSGPPSNAAAQMAAALSGMHQPSITSLFQSAMMPPNPYHHQAFPFMMPTVNANSGQHKLPQMYTQQGMDEDSRSKSFNSNPNNPVNLSCAEVIRLQAFDKLKDGRPLTGHHHQSTPPPGMGQFAPPGQAGFVSNAQLQPLLTKKQQPYGGGGQQHWQA